MEPAERAAVEARPGLTLLYPIHVVEGAEARVAGLPLAAQLRAIAPNDITLRLSGGRVSDAVWSLPVVDAIVGAFPRARLRVEGDGDAARILRTHLALRAWRSFASAWRSRSALTVHLASLARDARLERTDAGAELIVPRAPYPTRVQHASAHTVDGAQTAGLSAKFAPPRLRLDPLRAHEGRVILRARAKRARGPIVLLLPERGGFPAASYAKVADALVETIGAATFTLGAIDVPGVATLDEHDVLRRAGLLSLAAVCIGDDGDLAHLAAATGAPTLIVHGPTSPTRTGPAASLGASVFTTRGTCEGCEASPGRRCLACLEPARVAKVAEDLAARRWPMDRLLRWLP